MAWIEMAEAAGDADPVKVFFRDKLCGFIREYFDQLDRVTVSWRRTQQWLPAPIGLALPTGPKERALTTPEEGAAKICERAFEWAETNRARYIRFEGYGTSKRGDTAQKLFAFQFRPEHIDDDDDDKNGKAKPENAAVAAATVLNDSLVNMGSFLDKSHSREMLTVDKLLAMCDRQTQNTSAVMWGIATERQMRRDEQDHTERMADMDHEHETTEKLVDMVGKPFGKAFEAFLSRAFGLEDEAFNGKTFAARLSSIIRSIGNRPGGEERLEKAKALCEKEAWTVLENMSKAGSDAAFTELGKKFLEVLPGDDPNIIFRKLMEILGQGPAHALLKLIDDAGIAK